MTSVPLIFAELGGPAEIGRAIGKPTEHATAMKRRGSIPVRYWPQIIQLAAAKGKPEITYEALAAVHARSDQALAS